VSIITGSGTTGCPGHAVGDGEVVVWVWVCAS